MEGLVKTMELLQIIVCLSIVISAFSFAIYGLNQLVKIDKTNKQEMDI